MENSEKPFQGPRYRRFPVNFREKHALRYTGDSLLNMKRLAGFNNVSRLQQRLLRKIRSEFTPTATRLLPSLPSTSLLTSTTTTTSTTIDTTTTDNTTVTTITITTATTTTNAIAVAAVIIIVVVVAIVVARKSEHFRAIIYSIEGVKSASCYPRVSFAARG